MVSSKSAMWERAIFTEPVYTRKDCQICTHTFPFYFPQDQESLQSFELVPALLDYIHDEGIGLLLSLILWYYGLNWMQMRSGVNYRNYEF